MKDAALLPIDRWGRPLAAQLDLVDDDCDVLLPNSYHVHICMHCGCEFVCTGGCDTDLHNYGDMLRGCQGCDLPYFMAATGRTD